MSLEILRRLLEYSDWANDELCNAASGLADDLLDRPFEMGRGSLRKTLLHVWAGEDVWLKRCQGVVEAPWPNEDELLPIASLRRRIEATSLQRKDFLASLEEEDFSRVQPYRDSLGSFFSASLCDMLLQGINHSVHHRAQAVNILRRLGEAPPELDYMMRIRRPA